MGGFKTDYFKNYTSLKQHIFYHHFKKKHRYTGNSGEFISNVFFSLDLKSEQAYAELTSLKLQY